MSVQTGVASADRATELDDLRAAVRAFLANRSSERDVREAMDSATGYSELLWQQLAEQLGLLGLIVPEEHGGAGGGYPELVVVMAEMGRALLCAPFLSTAVLSVTTVLQAQDAAAADEILPGIAAGRTVATVAALEETGRWQEREVRTVARRAGPSWALTGRKYFVLDGARADKIVVAARGSGGISLFVVDGDAPGLTRHATPTMDQTRRQAIVDLADTPATLLGAEGEGWATLRRALDRTGVALAAEQLGGAQRCLEMAVGYARERVQFGRAIGSFQAVKHTCADMLVRVEAARSAVLHASRCAAAADAADNNDNNDNGDGELPVAARLAQAYCSTAYEHVAAENIQVHGGIGFAWEHPAHLYYKRALSSRTLFGEPGFHLDQLALAIGMPPCG